MADPESDASVSDDVLAAVTEAMIALHARYHGRAPVSARTRMMGDDMLAVMLGDPYTDVEKTMIELGRKHVVHETRGEFQHAIRHKFIEVVEQLSGRAVLAFISNHHVGPDLAVELFWLDGAEAV